MNRTSKLKLNSIASLFNRLIILLSGLILPRLILKYYGSEINGLTASIKQFLSIITFLDLGVGSVVQSALYKPLINKKEKELSIILSSAKQFFHKIALIISVYIIGLLFVYPLVIQGDIDFLPTAFLILSMSINVFSQYYFGIVNELLLNADQRAYVQYSSEIIVVTLNIIISAFLIINGTSIQIVMLSTSLVYLLRPIFLRYYVNKNYNIRTDVEVKGNPLNQKWNGMAQHIAFTIQHSVDIVILTLFSTLENVSIYAIHNMVVQGISLFVTAVTADLKAFFGNLIASGEIKLFNQYFTRIEWITHTVIIYLFGMTAILINPFVMIYTSGINDIDYYSPLFSLLLVLSQITKSLRSPYHSVILAAGHYKQTQISSVVEVLLNIIVSILLVNRFGIIGVTIGTMIAMSYRTTYIAWYLSKNILYRPLNLYIKQLIIDLIMFITMLFLGSYIINRFIINNIFNWLISAVVLGVVFLILIILINIVFYRELTTSFLKRLIRK